MTRIVTKATAIQFIDSKCHIKKQKSCKTALSDYYASVSCDLLLLIPSGWTHTHANILTFADEMISRNQACTGLGPVHTCFKKMVVREFHSQIYLSATKEDTLMVEIDDLGAVKQDDNLIPNSTIENARIVGILSLENYVTCLDVMVE